MVYYSRIDISKVLMIITVKHQKNVWFSKEIEKQKKQARNCYHNDGRKENFRKHYLDNQDRFQ